MLEMAQAGKITQMAFLDMTTLELQCSIVEKEPPLLALCYTLVSILWEV